MTIYLLTRDFCKYYILCKPLVTNIIINLVIYKLITFITKLPQYIEEIVVWSSYTDPI